VLPARLTGENYLNFLNVDLPGLLEEIPLEIRRAMWFMHDGAPAHFTLNDLLVPLISTVATFIYGVI
jgi:hypothetical protein